MNMNLPEYSKGFTLIELLVVMSVVAIIGGGIIPSFSKYTKDQNLKQAQEQLKSDLRTVQNRALTGAMSNVEKPAGTRIRYWGVRLVSGSSAVDYFISSDTPCPPFSASTTTVTSTAQGTFTIPNNIIYTGTSGCLFFDIRNGDIVSTGVTSPINVNYRNNTNTPDVPIIFNSAGLIY